MPRGKNSALKYACEKTELCWFYHNRRCLRGDECDFAHEVSTLRPKPNLLRTHPCWAFRKGACTAGDTCPYAHDDTSRALWGKSSFDMLSSRAATEGSLPSCVPWTQLRHEAAEQRAATDGRLPCYASEDMWYEGGGAKASPAKAALEWNWPCFASDGAKVCWDVRKDTCEAGSPSIYGHRGESSCGAKRVSYRGTSVNAAQVPWTGAATDGMLPYFTHEHAPNTGVNAKAPSTRVATDGMLPYFTHEHAPNTGVNAKVSWDVRRDACDAGNGSVFGHRMESSCGPQPSSCGPAPVKAAQAPSTRAATYGMLPYFTHEHAPNTGVNAKAPSTRVAPDGMLPYFTHEDASDTGVNAKVSWDVRRDACDAGNGSVFGHRMESSCGPQPSSCGPAPVKAAQEHVSMAASGCEIGGKLPSLDTWKALHDGIDVKEHVSIAASGCEIGGKLPSLDTWKALHDGIDLKERVSIAASGCEVGSELPSLDDWKALHDGIDLKEQYGPRIVTTLGQGKVAIITEPNQKLVVQNGVLSVVDDKPVKRSQSTPARLNLR